MATRKLAPALAAGCTAVLKPAAETPLTALAIAELLIEAGLPKEAVQVITTTDAGGVVSAWLQDQRVRKVSFTGSTGVGQTLLRQAANRVLNMSMELGGNAPFIVFDDADVAAAVDGAMVAKFRGGGQACTAANRFYVHSDVLEQFTAGLASRVETLSVGRAADGCAIGPLISAAAVQRAQEAVDRVLQQGRTGNCAERIAGLAGVLLPAHRARRRPGRCRHPAGGDLRPGRLPGRVAGRGRAAALGERQRVRPSRLCTPATFAGPFGSANASRPGWSA